MIAVAVDIAATNEFWLAIFSRDSTSVAELHVSDLKTQQAPNEQLARWERRWKRRRLERDSLKTLRKLMDRSRRSHDWISISSRGTSGDVVGYLIAWQASRKPKG